MNVLLTGLAALLLPGFVQVQDLLPELAGEAGKHKTAVAELEKQRCAAAAQAAKTYVDALNQMEKAATAKGEVKTIEAVAKDREAALSGTLAPELPAGLPALRLQGTRKALLMKLGKINADAAVRKQRLDGHYFGVLTALAAKAEPESALAKQIATEREELLAGKKEDGGGANGGKTKADKVARGKNIVVNGDFEKIGADGKPEGWAGVEWVTVQTEAKNSYIRLDEKVVNPDGTAGLHQVKQEVDLPLGPKTLILSMRLRTKACASRANINPKMPGFSIAFKDAEGRIMSYLTAEWSGKNGPWIDIQKSGLIPAGAVTGGLVISNGRCPGQIDFDDVEVTFK